VQALIAARIDTLRPELKSVLQDASVVGRIFWNGAAAAIARRTENDVRRDLNELVHKEFVRPVRLSSMGGEAEFAFWHAVVRDVAYQQIPRAPRAEKHLAAAAWIERAADDRLDDHAEILVYHYGQALELMRSAGVEAAEVEQALLRFLLLAGDRAIQLDMAAAETYYRRAVELAGSDRTARAKALAKLGSALSVRGEVAASIEVHEEAIGILRSVDLRAAAVVMGSLGLSLWARGDTERAQAVRAEALAILEDDPGPEFVEVSGKTALALAIAGRYDEATALSERGLAVAAALGVEEVTAHLQTRAAVRGHQGDPDCADDLRSSLEISRRLGLARPTGIAMNNLADSLAWFESMGRGLEMWDEAIEYCTPRGLDALTLWQRGERLRALFHLGRWDEVESESKELLHWDEEHGRSQLGAFARTYLALVQAHRGSAEQAAELLPALLELARKSGDEQELVPALATAGLVEFARGDEVGALDHVRELEQWATSTQTRTWRSFCLTWPARIATALGEADVAAAFLDDFAGTFAWYECARPGAQALLAEASGDRAGALRLFRHAADRWVAFGSVVEEGYALLGAGRCGDTEAAREAAAIFGRLRATPVTGGAGSVAQQQV
jgi:tetratricopeptide (TPR) repeat protein